MAHPQLLGAIKKKRRLGQSQKFGRHLGVQAGLFDGVHLLHEAILSKLSEVAVLSNVQKQKQSQKKKKRGRETEYVPKQDNRETILIKCR